MQVLIDFVRNHTVRGACLCGQCIDAPENPAARQPEGHTVDLEFFEISAVNNPDANELRRLISENKQGAFNTVDLFDGAEHGYMEIGGWLGDQGLALQLMGLGSLLGLWKLLTPSSILGDSMPADLKMKMAQGGLISIQVQRQPEIV